MSKNNIGNFIFMTKTILETLFCWKKQYWKLYFCVKKQYWKLYFCFKKQYSQLYCFGTIL